MRGSLHGSHRRAPRRGSAISAGGSGCSSPPRPTCRGPPPAPPTRAHVRPSTLLRVVVVAVYVTVALCARGGATTRCGRCWRPVADSAGGASPGLGRAKRRSAEVTDLECASDLRLARVNARECPEAEIETGAESDALSAERGLRCDRIECSDPCAEVVGSRKWI
ncbi:hypothetical protein EDB92DRAFT_1128750 [Lactarius akahatsu]|uniref:Uncharacterized protein n=1 Tax=Lactarius akahatsu TaxID=416441 RepID=A0AAD4LB97_9AGAM|nr:hypothetical protein EDB92DRAFT_1128750 [Lactarius akahatsu]